jgi:hypothetical protein
MSVAAVRTGYVDDSALPWLEGAIVATVGILLVGVLIVVTVILGAISWRRSRRRRRAEWAGIVRHVHDIKTRPTRPDARSSSPGQSSPVEVHQDGTNDPAHDPDAPRARAAKHALRSDDEPPSEPPPDDAEQTMVLFSIVRPYMSAAWPPRDGAGRMSSERV